jgi:hypothetical protein
MKFIRVHIQQLAVFVLAAFFLVSCSASQSSRPVPTLQENASALFICSDLADQPLFDLQSAAVMQTLIGESQLDQLGEERAKSLANDLFSGEGTFCDLTVPADLQSALDEIQALIDSGKDGEADVLIDELLKSIEADDISASAASKNAAPAFQAGGDRTRAKVRNLLEVAGRAYLWGNDQKFEDALDAARQTYQNWGSEAVDSATIKEALRIAAEASLLGLDDLSEQAKERARDLAELDLMGELQSYQPCSATKEDTGRLLDTAAGAELLGVDTEDFDFMAKVREWIEIQELRKKGEDVPQCDIWQIDLVLDMVWDRGSHLISWEGRFKVLEDGTLEGSGTGVLSTHTEVNCVNVMTGEQSMSTTDVSGTFTFNIEGKFEEGAEGGKFKFLFPAEVEYSGVDTCNEFDEATYLPAIVIEEINVFGGPENYDMERDTIYMVLPAQDGATQVYETLIGPVELRLRYLGAP